VVALKLINIYLEFYMQKDIMLHQVLCSVCFNVKYFSAFGLYVK
jgi:hypothetical protein